MRGYQIVRLIPLLALALGQSSYAQSEFQFVKIPAGKFMMGAKDDPYGKWWPSTAPVHPVKISAFEMQKTPVTQLQWWTLMGYNPSRYSSVDDCGEEHMAPSQDVELCPNYPVEGLKWEDTQAFIFKLNVTSKGGYTYRLPTEAEWEYALRAGTTTTWFFGDEPDALYTYAWEADVTSVPMVGHEVGIPHPVGQNQPNPWGLYDMIGLGFQWVQDFKADYPNSVVEVTNPQGPKSGSEGHAYRGTNFFTTDQLQQAASATRPWTYLGEPKRLFGFRLVREKK